MKNVLGTEPTTNNAVTIRRYHVSYRRADGRNTPGVDVPYGFDGAAAITIPGGGTATLGFEIVRHVAKAESPLAQLSFSRVVITTIADVTFYGTDQVGNDISVTASMQIDFGDFGDYCSHDRSYIASHISRRSRRARRAPFTATRRRRLPDRRSSRCRSRSPRRPTALRRTAHRRRRLPCTHEMQMPRRCRGLHSACRRRSLG